MKQRHLREISRRGLLKTGAAATGAMIGSGLITGFPTHLGRRTRSRCASLAPASPNINAIAEKCKADLGITLEMTATDSDAAAQRAVTQPDSYDIADIEYWILKKVFPAGVIQPMDVKKLKYYDKIVPLFKTGKLKPDSVIAQGTAPHTVGYVEKAGDKTFANGETELFTMVPTIYNADTLGIPPGPRRPRHHLLGPISWTRLSRARPRSSTSRRSASWMRR